LAEKLKGTTTVGIACREGIVLAPWQEPGALGIFSASSGSSAPKQSFTGPGLEGK